MKYRRITAAVVLLALLALTPAHAAVSETISDAALKVAQEVSSQNTTETGNMTPEMSSDITEQYKTSAETLYRYGLMKGTKEGYALDEKPSRSETAAMLVRLLGEEESVLNTGYSSHFVDVPDWADTYVGYLYDNGYVNGVSKGMFGSNDDVSADTYGYFLMNALGYNSEEDELSPATALSLSKEKGILTESEIQQLKTAPFNRGTMAYMSCRALESELKDDDTTLVQNLDSQGVLLNLELPPEQPVPQAEPEEVVQDTASLTSQNIIYNANRYLGIRYRSGGKTPATGFDCSGFVGYVMIQSGVWNQYYGSCNSTYSQCTVVSRENAVPGDIVFFTGTYSTSKKYTHVGVYVGGDKMIHASSNKGISLDGFDSGYWASHYVCIARPNVLI